MLFPLLLVLVSCVAIFAVAAFLRQRRQLRRLEEIAARMRNLDNVCLAGLGTALDAMRRDDLSVRVEPTTRPLDVGAGGVVGELATTFNSMLARAQGGLQAYNDVADRYAFIMQRLDQVGAMLRGLQDNCLTDLTGGLRALGDGDLTRRVVPRTTPVPADAADVVVVAQLVATANDMLGNVQTSVDTYNSVADSQHGMIARLVSLAASLDGASGALAGNAAEVEHGTEEVARAASELASGVEAQSSLLTSTAGATQRAGEASTTAHDLTDQGVETAQRASTAMLGLRDASTQVTAAMRSLGEKSARIGDIVAAITGIAEQTNLLALNAAIEAARAGEQGRGFAVVADEVRKLAEESQTAAGTISEILGEIRQETGSAADLADANLSRTEEGAELVDGARTMFERIATSVAQVNALVQEIDGFAASAAEHSARSSTATEHVAAATQQTTASMQEVAGSSRELARMSSELIAVTGAFRLDGARGSSSAGARPLRAVA